jgi:hypothetical protein
MISVTAEGEDGVNLYRLLAWDRARQHFLQFVGCVLGIVLVHVQKGLLRGWAADRFHTNTDASLVKDENVLIKLQTESFFTEQPWMDVWDFAVTKTVGKEALLSHSAREGGRVVRGHVGDTLLNVMFLFQVDTAVVREWLEVDDGANLEAIGHCYDRTKMKDVRLEKGGRSINPRSPYHGENCLHIAIVQKQKDKIDLLLEKQREWNLLCDKPTTRSSSRYTTTPTKKKINLYTDACTGNFFRLEAPSKKGLRNSPCYFGESVIGFAVCSNSREVVDMLLSDSRSGHPRDCIFAAFERHVLLMEAHHSNIYGEIQNRGNQIRVDDDDSKNSCKSKGTYHLPDLLYMKDSHGNSVMHLAVIYSLKDMFDHIVEKEREYKDTDFKALLLDKTRQNWRTMLCMQAAFSLLDLQNSEGCLPFLYRNLPLYLPRVSFRLSDFLTFWYYPHGFRHQVASADF